MDRPSTFLRPSSRSPLPVLSSEPPSIPDILDAMRGEIRLRHYSIRTEEVYLQWARRLMQQYPQRHPARLGSSEIEQFLSDLARRRNVASSTQNQALAAILFLYRHVLKVELPWLEKGLKGSDPFRSVSDPFRSVARVFARQAGVALSLRSPTV